MQVALKCVIFDNCERSGEKRKKWGQRSVPDVNLLHSSYRGVVASCDDVVIGTRGVEPRLKTSVQSHGMRWTSFETTSEFWFQTCGVALVTGARLWFTVHTRATVIRDRDRCKIYIGRYWMSISSIHNASTIVRDYTVQEPPIIDNKHGFYFSLILDYMHSMNRYMRGLM